MSSKIITNIVAIVMAVFLFTKINFNPIKENFLTGYALGRKINYGMITTKNGISTSQALPNNVTSSCCNSCISPNTRPSTANFVKMPINSALSGQGMSQPQRMFSTPIEGMGLTPSSALRSVRNIETFEPTSSGGTTNNTCKNSFPPLTPPETDPQYTKIANEVYGGTGSGESSSTLPISDFNTDAGENVRFVQNFAFSSRRSRLAAAGDMIRGDLPINKCNERNGWFQVYTGAEDFQQGALPMISSPSLTTGQAQYLYTQDGSNLIQSAQIANSVNINANNVGPSAVGDIAYSFTAFK